jgi:hypothetical protein
MKNRRRLAMKKKRRDEGLCLAMKMKRRGEGLR